MRDDVSSNGLVDGDLVRFAVAEERLPALLRDSRRSALERLLLSEWGRYRLRGAALIYDSPGEGNPYRSFARTPLAKPRARLSASCEILAVNVLSRACGGILLAARPPRLERDWLERVLWSDDPRLVAAAREGGVRLIE